MALYKTFAISGGNQNGQPDRPPDRTGGLSYQAVWAGLDAFDATVAMEWSNDGVTWYPMVTNEPMLRTPNNGAFIVKTTPVYVNGSSGPTWSPPITSGSTFAVDSMDATTNPPLKYVFP